MHLPPLADHRLHYQMSAIPFYLRQQVLRVAAKETNLLRLLALSMEHHLHHLGEGS
jgi:hypothetical protein